MCGQDHSSDTVINYIWSGTTFDLKPHPHVKKERKVNVVRVEKSFTSVKPTPQFIFVVPCGDSNTITIVHRDENVHLSRHLDCQTSWAVAMDNHKKKTFCPTFSKKKKPLYYSDMKLRVRIHISSKSWWKCGSRYKISDLLHNRLTKKKY